MASECKYAEHCGGGHTTAQHGLRVCERFIREAPLGREFFEALKDAVEKAARYEDLCS